jgi:hypothetical protein
VKKYGIDVSHHQNPASLPWATFALTSSFAIIRGSYGLMKDRVTLEHVRRARSAGLKVGLYHFFRPSQDAADQLAVFRDQLAAAHIGPGDIVPTLDVEADPLPKPGAHVSPAWQDGVKHILDDLVEQYGDAMVYITQREFGMLGKPAWLLDRPLWVAHYTGASKPATPGGAAATIWQHRVAPYDPDGAGGYDSQAPVLDQNRLLGELPLIATARDLVNSTLPPPPEDGDEGLEDLLEQLQASHWERIQNAVGMAGANLREHARLASHAASDTDPSELAPESEPYANER